MNSLVSIIAPVYNVEKYIDRCVSSIVGQTYGNWELILVDDGSPDNSGLLCDKLAQSDQRIRVIHKKNGGVSSARNEGLNQAHGEWVMFVDSDDWMTPDCVEKSLQYIVRNKLDVLQFNFFITDDNGVIAKEGYSNPNSFSLEDYVREKLVGVNVWQGIYRRSVIEDNHVRFNTEMKYAEDGVFVCEVLSHSKRIMHVEDALYFYYYNNESVMRCKAFDAYIDSMLMQIDFLDRHSVFQSMYKNLVTMNVGGLCTFKLKKKQRERLKKVWLKYRDGSPYVHLNDYHESRSVEKVFIPLQKYSFTLAWLCTAMVTSLYWLIKRK